MIKVTFKGRENSPEAVSAAEIITLFENNRSRLRTLGSMILTVCGLLLSSSFIVLFFVLNDVKFRITWIVPAILFGTCISLTLSIIFSVLSATPQPPSTSAVTTKIQLMNFLATSHRREYKLTILSVSFLIVSITLFIVALVVFGISLM